ncbi:serine hydrolase [Rhodococcus sp. NPDC003318]|uniref:serine hydrolase n=1 Tax=Rhodococcus sp. NPDC003318 TaxID=3364503 RepID=UPI0036AB7A2E
MRRHRRSRHHHLLLRYRRQATDTPAGPDTQFEIGSQTKIFTALLAQRRNAGTSRLTDPAARYVPEGVTLPTLWNRRSPWPTS